MSDEMVQEKPEPDAGSPQENGQLAVAQSESETVAPGSSQSAQAPPAAAANTEPPASPAPESSAPGASEESDEEAFARAVEELDMSSRYDDSLRKLREGDVISGTVMRVDREGVLVDVGAKSEGIIRMNELSREPNFNPNDIVQVGDRIRVFVIEPENADGNPILSKKRADFEQAWEKVQHAKETDETLHAMVTDRVKGGLVVDLGIRGFVPASHVGNGSLKNNLDKYVGQSIALKVIEVDKERRKVVLSNKLAVQEEREARSAETKATLAPGQVRHGIVRRLTNYGAFIDLGGIDGLLHISEMSWTRINDPKEVLREGQELDVLILKMDLGQNRVSLGLRQILPDPWSAIADRYREGDVITGTITRLVPFGAFVQVEGGVEGIIPNNEMPRGKGGKGAPPVNANEEVTVKVIGLRPEERKMTLSLRALQPPEERDQAPEGQVGERPARQGRGGRDRGDREDFSRYAPGRNEEPRFTIGDAVAQQQRRDRKRERREVDEDFDEIGDIELSEDVQETAADHGIDAAEEAQDHAESGDGGPKESADK